VARRVAVLPKTRNTRPLDVPTNVDPFDAMASLVGVSSFAVAFTGRGIGAPLAPASRLRKRPALLNATYSVCCEGSDGSSLIAVGAVGQTGLGSPLVGPFTWVQLVALVEW